ncbi:MAG: aldose epimerase family protein [Saprospiraceae bacterium]
MNFQEVCLENEFIRCKILDYGAKLQCLELKQKNGTWLDIISGYNTVEEYMQGSAYYGAICGRYANRINKGSFTLNGKSIQLDINYKGHHLHGGSLGIQSKKWDFINIEKTKTTLSLHCPDMEMGYPGNLELKVEYILEENGLLIQYSGISDQDTIINLAPHFYFNLNGKGDILNHKLRIDSENIVEVNEEAIPSGRIVNISNTVLDFNAPTEIGKKMDKSDVLLREFGGFDHCYTLKEDRPHIEAVAELISDQTNCRMLIFTSQPALQLYTCNWGDKTDLGKSDELYREHSFVCIESQHYPDSPNRNNFPSTLLRKAELYSHFTRYQFNFVDGK